MPDVITPEVERKGSRRARTCLSEFVERGIVAPKNQIDEP